MPRGVKLSNVLTGTLIPLCIWGLVCSLMLYLIQIRTYFIFGGAGRLRLAVVAFSGAVILLQRLSRRQGESLAIGYGFAVGGVITLFAIQHAFAYQTNTSWKLVFIVNMALFITLWWVTHQITSACSVDSAEEVAKSTETGSFSDLGLPHPFLRLKSLKERIFHVQESKNAAETKLEDRLPTRHPGTVLLYFSMFAIPAFGLGFYLLGGRPGNQLRLGVFLFVYLWCVLALLFLSSLRQLSAYFEDRKVELPNVIGVTWLSMGFFIVTAGLVSAFLLPQPPSVASLFVRDQITAVYKGPDDTAGAGSNVGNQVQPVGGGQKSGSGSADPNAQKTASAGGNTKGKKGGGGSRRSKRRPANNAPPPTKNVNAPTKPNPNPATQQLNQVAKGGSTPRQKLANVSSESTQGVSIVFQAILKFFLVLGIMGGVVVTLVLMFAVWLTITNSRSGARWRKREKSAKKKRSPGDNPEGFRNYKNPFGATGGIRDGDELVRYLWEAMLAFCQDFGTPCGSDQTPLEFVHSSPDALAGFEPKARFLAELINYSEFSGEPIPESIKPKLEEFWNDLESHIRTAA